MFKHDVIKNDIYREFELEIKNIFGENLIFGFIFGGFSKGYATNKHDIDMFICLENRNDEQEKKFQEFYFRLHNKFGLPPDFIDPGEITTLNHLADVVKLLKAYQIRRVVRTFDEYEAIVWGDIFSGEVSCIVGDASAFQSIQNACLEFPAQWRAQLLKLVDQKTLEAEGRLNPGEQLEDLNTTRLFRRCVTYLKRHISLPNVSLRQEDKFHVCILGGGGNVAEAVAANLVAKGHKVSQFRFSEPVEVPGIPKRPARSKERLSVVKFINDSSQACKLKEHNVKWLSKEGFDDVDVFITAYPSFMSEKLAEYIGDSIADRTIINLSDRFLGSFAFMKFPSESYSKKFETTWTLSYSLFSFFKYMEMASPNPLADMITKGILCSCKKSKNSIDPFLKFKSLSLTTFSTSFLFNPESAKSLKWAVHHSRIFSFFSSKETFRSTSIGLYLSKRAWAFPA